MAVYLTEEDVEAVLSIEDVVDAVEGSFRRQAAGEIDNRPRYRIGLDGGQLAVMAACDLGIGVAGVKTYAAGANGARFVVVLFDATTPGAARASSTPTTSADCGPVRRPASRPGISQGRARGPSA